MNWAKYEASPAARGSSNPVHRRDAEGRREKLQPQRTQSAQSFWVACFALDQIDSQLSVLSDLSALCGSSFSLAGTALWCRLLARGFLLRGFGFDQGVGLANQGFELFVGQNIGVG